MIPVSVNTPREKETKKENGLSGHQSRGWRAVSAEGLQDRGSPKRSVLFADTGSNDDSDNDVGNDLMIPGGE